MFQRKVILTAGITIPAILVGAIFASIPAAESDFVKVVVDMDAFTPGFQSNVNVPPGQAVVEDIAVYVFDPLEQRKLWGIGYIGAVDRGIAFGHVPDDLNLGRVESLTATVDTPVNPGNTGAIHISPAIDPGFPGPEVQYLEWGADQTAIIRQQPSPPVVRIHVTLSNAQAGDVFDFYLLDLVTAWSFGQRGAFSTVDPLSMDTGGDAVPDSTQSIHGVDPDPALPVPPAAYLVDYVDGGDAPGPATITVTSATSIDEPASPAPVAHGLYPSYPNPFKLAATIRYELGAPAPVRLGIYDLQGRLLRVLVSSPALGAGMHDGRWDGRDDAGREVPSGTYFYRLEVGNDAGNNGECRRLVLVR